jgi:hypothetical protein
MQSAAIRSHFLQWRHPHGLEWSESALVSIDPEFPKGLPIRVEMSWQDPTMVANSPAAPTAEGPSVEAHDEPQRF